MKIKRMKETIENIIEDLEDYTESEARLLCDEALRIRNKRG